MPGDVAHHPELASTTQSLPHYVSSFLSKVPESKHHHFDVFQNTPSEGWKILKGKTKEQLASDLRLPAALAWQFFMHLQFYKPVMVLLTLSLNLHQAVQIKSKAGSQKYFWTYLVEGAGVQPSWHMMGTSLHNDHNDVM